MVKKCYSLNKMFDLGAINKKKQPNCPPGWILVALTWGLLFAAAEGQESTLCDSLTRFTCDDGICISKARLCDNYWDCAEGEDELYCDSKHPFCERNETMASTNAYECKKQCVSHADCRSRRRKCICDDECGMSCINPKIRCRIEPPHVENSVGYEVQRRSQGKLAIVTTRRYLVGDVVKYQCRAGMKLIGPLPRCNGNGLWSREISTCVVNEDRPANLFRVAGGVNSTKNSWPWQVLITKKGKTPKETLSKGKLRGGGSLLNEKWVLTAAHLFPSSSSFSSYVISIGVFERPLGRELVSSTIQMFTPGAQYIHSEFSWTTGLNDIALLKIGARFDSAMSLLQNDTRGVIFGINAGKVLLPCTIPIRHKSLLQINVRKFAENCLYEEKNLVRENLTSVVTGFGHLDTWNGQGKLRSNPPKYLQQASVTLGDEEKCQTEINDINKKKSTNYWYSEKIICTKGEAVGSCKGDSGGPLMRKVIDGRSKKASWVQIGIVSYGFGCGFNHSGIYTNVARYIQWINEQIKHDYEIETLQLQNTKLNESLTQTRENLKKGIETLQLQNTKLNESLNENQETCEKEIENFQAQNAKLNRSLIGSRGKCKNEIETLQLQNTKLYESLTKTQENSKKEIETLQLQNTKLKESLTKAQETFEKACTYAEYFGQEFMRTISQGMIVKPVRSVLPPDLYRAKYMPPQNIRDYVCSEPITDPLNRWRMSGRACKSFPTRRRRKRYSTPENFYLPTRQTRDVLFLIDESSSVGPENFKKILNLVVAIISKLCGKIEVSPNRTKVALTSFDAVIHDHLNFNDYIKLDEATKRIQNIRYSSSTRGNTCLVEALRHARKNVFNSTHGARKSDDVSGMIILVTDGCANCKGSIAEEVREFRRADITFMLVTIGDETGCAKATSKLVNADHCYLNYEMANWDDFDSFVAAINSHVGCQSYWAVPDKTCSSHSEPKLADCKKKTLGM